MSIHTARSRYKAAQMGGLAGAPEAAELWELSKRELIELALRLADRIDGCAGDATRCTNMVTTELTTLRAQKIV